MIETEKKYCLTHNQLELVRKSLAAIDAEFIGDDFEENTIYSNEILSSKKAILRIRKIADNTILTFKRRIQNDFDVKQQIEYETEVADAGALSQIIAELGLEPVLIYEKRRKTYKFRDVELVLDELPFGLFMEIEGSITAIKEAEILLGIEDLKTEHETYPRLTAKFGTKNGDVMEARF